MESVSQSDKWGLSNDGTDLCALERHFDVQEPFCAVCTVTHPQKTGHKRLTQMMTNQMFNDKFFSLSDSPIPVSVSKADLTRSLCFHVGLLLSWASSPPLAGIKAACNFTGPRNAVLGHRERSSLPRCGLRRCVQASRSLSLTYSSSQDTRAVQAGPFQLWNSSCVGPDFTKLGLTTANKTYLWRADTRRKCCLPPQSS